MKIPNAPFSVFDKKIECLEKRHSVKDLSIRTSIHNYDHLVRHRLGATTTKGQVDYETTLRNYSIDDKKLFEMEKGWSPLPKIERREPP